MFAALQLAFLYNTRAIYLWGYLCHAHCHPLWKLDPETLKGRIMDYMFYLVTLLEHQMKFFLLLCGKDSIPRY